MLCDTHLIKLYLCFQTDIIANSVGPKQSPSQDVLNFGLLAKQFAKVGGQQLVEDLADSKHGCFGYGEIRFTDSHNIHKGDNWPQKICHFCVPTRYEGETTYLIGLIK